STRNTETSAPSDASKNLQNSDMLHQLLRHSREEAVMNRLQLSPTLAACYKLAPTQKERAVHITINWTAQLFKTKGAITMQVMKWSVIALAVAAGSTQMAVASSQSESKGFIEDSSFNIFNRALYF